MNDEEVEQDSDSYENTNDDDNVMNVEEEQPITQRTDGKLSKSTNRKCLRLF